jgi:hypothetical protein
LVFKPHTLSDRTNLARGDKIGALSHRVRQWLVRHERIDEAAPKRLSGALQRVQRDTSADLGLLKLYDAWLGHAKSLPKLSGGHAQGVPDSPEPALGRTLDLGQRAQNDKAFVEMADRVFHVDKTYLITNEKSIRLTQLELQILSRSASVHQITVSYTCALRNANSLEFSA